MVLAAGAGLAGVVLLHPGTAPSGAVLAAPARAQRGDNTTNRPARTPTKQRPPTTTVPRTAHRAATGELVNYGYGVLSVRVSVTGRRIATVSVDRLQTAEQYSQLLAQQAIPTLQREALSAQSWHIAAVSGATFTSEAYAMSLQSALDRLHMTTSR